MDRYKREENSIIGKETNTQEKHVEVHCKEIETDHFKVSRGKEFQI